MNIYLIIFCVCCRKFLLVGSLDPELVVGVAVVSVVEDAAVAFLIDIVLR